MAKGTVIVLYGGRSAERDVSVLSAESVVRAVDYSQFTVKTYFISQAGDFIATQVYEEVPGDHDRLMTDETLDRSHMIAPSAIYEEGAVVFPVLHGPMGEDGVIQGFLETLKMPYVGTGVLASSLAMDKISTKRVLRDVGIPQVADRVMVAGDDEEAIIAEVDATFTYPVFVKPSNLGSSVGISKVDSKSQLKEAISHALRYDSRIVIEQGVDAREIEVAILGNETIATTLPGEVVKEVDFYDYQAKYIDNRITMAIPAELDDDVAAKMREYAALAFKTIGGSGLSRCDFFYTKDGEIFLNELNTMPGFTQWSMYPLLWENMGVSYSDLITRLVRLAQERFAKHTGYLF